MTRRIRLHGRGGTGVKLASRIVSRAAFLAGCEVQDSPAYGAERRGAPVAAFVRIATQQIRERGYIERPDVLAVMDESLLGDHEAAVLDGVGPHCLVLVNGASTPAALAARHGIPGRVVAVDLSAIALAALGRHLLSAPAAAFVVRAAALAPRDALERALRVELDDAGLVAAEVEANVAAARRVFDAAPVPDVPERAAAPLVEPAAPAFDVPHLPARIAAPAVSAAGTSALRTTAGWRVWRPVIDLERCTRCFLCFVLCPEGAIRLDADDRPVVDYAHCKGCLVCVEECPPDAIAQVREP